jgi:hypothetical protein
MTDHKKSTIISKGSDKPLAAKNRHYVDNKKFLEALVERRAQVQQAEKDGVEPPRVSEYIGECILRIAQGLSKHKSFSGNPTLRQHLDDMIGDAIRNCIKYVDNFNPEISKNPFAYFTQISSYAFIHRITLEEKSMYIKFKATMKSITDNTLATFDENSSVDQYALFDEDNTLSPDQFMNDFIKKYEEKHKIKLEAAKKSRAKKKGTTSLIDMMEENKKEDDTDE